LGDAHLKKAVDHFTAAGNAGAPSSKFVHETYEDLTVVRQDVA
jgi:hypothetical protein